MYDNFKIVNYNNSLVSPELFARPLSRLFSGDVIDGLTVIPGTGLQVTLQPGNALIRYGTASVASAREVSLVDNFNLAIGTADASNPRIDLVVVYVDMAVTLPSGTPTSANLDGKGVAKAKIVPGTPNANPVAALPAAIQSSVGAANPYTVVAQVRVDAGVSVIATNKITDVRSKTVLTTDKLGDTGWINPTLLNSYVVTNARTVSYRKTGNKVAFRGQIGKSPLDGNPMFILPVGFRPPTGMAHIFTVPGSSINIGKIQITDDGIVNLGGIPAGGSYVGLDAVLFTID